MTSSNVRYEDMGCWNDTSNRALSMCSTRKYATVDGCAAFAAQNLATTFALQNNSGTGQAQCCIVVVAGGGGGGSDDYKKYGEASSPCGPLGDEWVNHVYTISPPPLATPAASVLPPPPPPPRLTAFLQLQ